MRKTLVVVAMALALVSAPVAQTTRPVTFDDVMQVKGVGAATASPDGSQALYTVRQWEPASERDKDRMEARTRIWRVATSGTTPAEQLTFGERGDSQPQWSPDSRHISFVSSRGGDDAKAQIYLMRAGGGEAWKLTDSKESVTSYSWAPDSAHLAYVARDPLGADADAKIKKRDDERVYEGDFVFAHAWVVDVATRQSTQITEGRTFNVSGAPSWRTTLK